MKTLIHLGLMFRPQGYKSFFMCLTLSRKFQLLIKTKMLKNKAFYLLKHSLVILLINVKMPTIVGVLTFMSRINVMLMSIRKPIWLLTLCMLGNFSCFFVVCLIFDFSKNSFRNTIIVSSSLDPDQDRPDLGPNCLQKSSAVDRSPC